jgi:FAD/FMN-containing dehydrogenase
MVSATKTGSTPVPGEFFAAIAAVPYSTEEIARKQKSRDFYWYSPALRPIFDGLRADVVVTPRNEDDIVTTLKACYAFDVPLTVRGAGTGNYGQAVPMKGGVVLDLSGMTALKWVKPGLCRVEAGKNISVLDEELQAEGQELRLFPSTKRMATIGGFIAGGSGGVGAVTWGLLRDHGNVVAARVLTMEAEPRVLELRGDEINKVNHGYGTNGIITELEIALAPAYEWVDTGVIFSDFMQAAAFGEALTGSPGILKKLCTVIAAPVPQQYFGTFGKLVPDGKHLCITMIAPQAKDAFADLVKEHGGEVVYSRTAAEVQAARDLPIYEYCWNHTTMHALRSDRNITYLQTLFPPDNLLPMVEKTAQHFGDEVPMHLEFVRMGDKIACMGIQLVRYTTGERLQEIMDYLDAQGCQQFNPHAYSLEEGGMKEVDHLQRAFKEEADPKGLLNPGKMLAWENPDWKPEGNKVYLYSSAG